MKIEFPNTECDFCGKVTDCIQGPYDNCICISCAEEFAEEQEERDRNGTR